MIQVRQEAIPFGTGTIYFPHIEMFSFSPKECINLQKGSLQNKMELHF